jgi:hypothetical protein
MTHGAIYIGNDWSEIDADLAAAGWIIAPASTFRFPQAVPCGKLRKSRSKFYYRPKGMRATTRNLGGAGTPGAHATRLSEGEAHATSRATPLPRSLTATASGPWSWWHCAGTTSTSPPGACMYAGPRAGLPACIRYRRGKAGRCASSCVKLQSPHTSSSRSVTRRCP